MKAGEPKVKFTVNMEGIEDFQFFNRLFWPLNIFVANIYMVACHFFFIGDSLSGQSRPWGRCRGHYVNARIWWRSIRLLRKIKERLFTTTIAIWIVFLVFRYWMLWLLYKMHKSNGNWQFENKNVNSDKKSSTFHDSLCSFKRYEKSNANSIFFFRFLNQLPFHDLCVCLQFSSETHQMHFLASHTNFLIHVSFDFLIRLYYFTYICLVGFTFTFSCIFTEKRF